MNIIDKFAIEINSIFNDEGARKASNYISTFENQLKTMGIVAIAGAISIDRLFNSFGNKFAGLSMKADLMKSNIADLNQYITAGDMSIYTTGDAIKSDLEGLLDTLRKVKMTGQVPIGFQIAGINMNEKPEQILEKFRNLFKTMSPDMAYNIAEASGMSNLYQVLKLTKKEMQEMSGISFLTNEQIQNGLQASEMIKRVRNQLIILKDITLAELSPALTNILVGFFEWIKDNQGDVINLFKNTILVFQSFATATGRIISIFADFIKNIGLSKIGMNSLSFIFGTLLFILKPTWFYLSAFVIILEDLLIYLKTGGGAIGEFVDKFGKLSAFGVVAGITAITTALNLLSIKLLSINSTASLFIGKFGLLGTMMSVAGGVFTINEIIKDVKNKEKPESEKSIGNLLEKSLQGGLAGASLGSVIPGVGTIMGGIGGAFSGLSTGLYQNYFQKNNNMELPGLNSNIADIYNQQAQNNNTKNEKNINQNFNINVDARNNKDGIDIGNNIKKSLDLENLLIGGYR